MTENYEQYFRDRQEEPRRQRERPKFTVLYEDERVIAFDKAPGVATIPERYIAGVSLKEIAEERYGRLWTVHRIDKDTSGVVLFARDADAHKSLNDQFEARSVTKIYVAVLEGNLPQEEVRVDIPLVPDPSRPGSMKPSARGKDSVTVLRVREGFKGYTLAEAEPLTGRMHQIRVHCRAIGHPLLVDPLYGNRAEFMLSIIKRKYRDYGRDELPLIDRLTLHAERLTVMHPGTGDELMIEAPLPKDLRAVVSQMRKLRAAKKPEGTTGMQGNDADEGPQG